MGKVLIPVNGNVLPQGLTATPDKVLSGYYFIGEDKERKAGTIPTVAARTITPTNQDQYIRAGRYLSGNQVIAGDANLIASNIRSGVTIFGVTGNA